MFVHEVKVTIKNSHTKLWGLSFEFEWKDPIQQYRRLSGWIGSYEQYDCGSQLSRFLLGLIQHGLSWTKKQANILYNKLLMKVRVTIWFERTHAQTKT